ncbi:hypothetical protein IW262DRAFT_1400904 [Armillaria fumosa]|nr:hypothetical protein IW262DRAFT_1400904 [Armillaria fumosa]
MPRIHATHDNDNEDSQSSSSVRDDTHTWTLDDSEDDSELEMNIQQLVEHLTAYFSRRRRKSTRGMMGIQRRVHIVKGNDQFNYEEKFPEDKEHEEFGPTARVWRTYLEECAAYDIERVEGWRDGLDVLLVFAGLFSAVVTTFVAQTSQSLQVDNSAVTASLLLELINVQRAAGNGSLVNDVPHSGLTPFSDFHPTASDSWVNGLWFVSLSLSLSTALFAVLTKQWIHQYMSVPSGTPRDKCRVRHFRYMGLERWSVDLIIGMLPVLMSLSLGIFLGGLVLFLIPLRVPIASAVGSIAFTSFAAYCITNFLPIMYLSCPYRTPLVQYMFPIYAYAIRLCHWIISRCFRRGPPEKAEAEKPTGHTEETSRVVLGQPVRSLRAAEHAAVALSADDTDLYALSWLFEISSDPSVRNVVVQSLSALPLRSVNSLKSHVEPPRHQSMDSLMSRLDKNALNRVVYELLDTLRSGDNAPSISRELGRYMRTYLRFADPPGSDFLIGDVKEMLSPGTLAALQSVDVFLDSQIRDPLAQTVTAALMHSRYKPQLCLQPIVWASILRRLHPLGLSINVSLLLNEIPTSFWHPTCPPPPLVLTSGALRQSEIFIKPKIASIPAVGLKISSPSPEVDEPVPLCMAIRTCLYQYVFETIIQGHIAIQNVQGSVDYLGPTNESPHDPKLCFLLKMASASSLWDMPEVSYGERGTRHRYSHTFIGRILLNIGVHLDVHKFSLIDKNIPSFSLDANRQVVVKVLYEMISSAEFDSGPMCVKDCCIALIIFLRVLNSTSHRPRFLPKDWCTPELAANSVRLAFKDDEWKSWVSVQLVVFKEDIQRFTRATELALYFFSCPLFVNQAVEHFVTWRLFDSVADVLIFASIDISDVVTVVRQFLLALVPDRLDSQIFQQAKRYVFEPPNLFTTCALLLVHEDEIKSNPVLRYLALLSPNHSSWLECLEKLDTVPGYFNLRNLTLNQKKYFRRKVEFQMFVRWGCVGDYGMDSAGSKQDEDGCRNNPPTSMHSPSSLWRRFRWHRDRETTNKEVVTSGGQV